MYGIICNSPGFTLIFHMFTVDWVQSRHLLIVLRCEVQVLKALPFNRKTLWIPHNSWRETLHQWSLIPSPGATPNLVRVCWILPGHMEHVSDFLCQANPGSAVGSNIDSWDTAFPRHLWSLLEQHILLRPEGANLMCDVIADHNNLTAGRVLRGSESHPPCYHANLGNHGIIS